MQEPKKVLKLTPHVIKFMQFPFSSLCFQQGNIQKTIKTYYAS